MFDEIPKSMKISRLVCFLSWSFLIWGTHEELQPSQRQVLLQLRKQLEYPKQLDNWVTPGTDLCFLSSPQANITCQDSIITEITIFGADLQTRPTAFNGFPLSPQTLSQNFSIDSLVATLSRLNSLRALSLVSLGMWGPIPDKIYRLHSLDYLDLSWNFFYGSVPQTFPRIPNLQILKLDGNFLNGTFPDWLDSFSNLTSLSVRNNMLTGPLPPSVQRITSLTDINLSGNAISGELPDLHSLTRLRWLDLSNNRLDSTLASMPKDVIVVMLRNNSLSGRIPEQYGKLNQLQQLDLSFNALTEIVPPGLFTLPRIVSLNLGSNMLSGSLPMHLSCGNNLELVDISNNRLRGVLPSCLSSNSKTRVVKIGGNCLSIDLQHQNLETYCVEKRVDNEKSQGKKNVGLLIGVIGGIGLVVLLLALGFLVLCRRYCPSGSSEQHLLLKTVQDNSVTGGYTAEILTNASNYDNPVLFCTSLFTFCNCLACCSEAFILYSSGYISDAAKLSLQGSPAYRQFVLDEIKEATNDFDKSTLMGEGSNGKVQAFEEAIL